MHTYPGRSCDCCQLHTSVSKHAAFILTGPAWLHAGIMPIMTYGGFKRMTSFCKTAIPADISDTLESIKDNDEAVKVRDLGLMRVSQKSRPENAAGVERDTESQHHIHLCILCYLKSTVYGLPASVWVSVVTVSCLHVVRY